MSDNYTDIHGNQRTFGLLLPPTGFVSCMPVFEDAFPEWSNEQINAACTDPNRKVGRKLFDSKWIHNQGSVGSCNGWAAAGSYARARYLRGFTDGMQFSGSWLYSLMNGGFDRGSALEDGLVVSARNGFAELSLCPWSQIYPHLQTRREECVRSAEQHKAFKPRRVATKQGFRTALAMGFPVIVAIQFGQHSERLSGGIAGVHRGPGNHAVLCDDIAIVNGREVYDYANSHGTQYGDEGRAYLVWSHFEDTFPVHAFYAIPTTQEGDG